MSCIHEGSVSATYVGRVEQVVHVLVGLAGQRQHLVRVVHGRLVGHVLVLDHDACTHTHIHVRGRITQCRSGPTLPTVVVEHCVRGEARDALELADGVLHLVSLRGGHCVGRG